jgi:hypothetical protein
MPLWEVTYVAVVAAATEEEAIEQAADYEMADWHVRMVAQQSLAEAFAGIGETTVSVQKQLARADSGHGRGYPR